MAYINIAGVGFHCDASGTVDLTGLEVHQPLRLEADCGTPPAALEIDAPEGGWTNLALREALEANLAFIEGDDCIGAFIGGQMIGHSQI